MPAPPARLIVPTASSIQGELDRTCLGLGWDTMLVLQRCVATEVQPEFTLLFTLPLGPGLPLGLPLCPLGLPLCLLGLPYCLLSLPLSFWRAFLRSLLQSLFCFSLGLLRLFLSLPCLPRGFPFPRDLFHFLQQLLRLLLRLLLRSLLARLLLLLRLLLFHFLCLFQQLFRTGALASTRIFLVFLCFIGEL